MNDGYFKGIQTVCCLLFSLNKHSLSLSVSIVNDNISEISPSSTRIEHHDHISTYSNNKNYLDKFINEINRLRKRCLGMMNGFNLSITLEQGDQSILDRSESVDLCSTLIEYNNISVKLYFDSKYLNLTHKEKLCALNNNLTP